MVLTAASPDGALAGGGGGGGGQGGGGGGGQGGGGDSGSQGSGDGGKGADRGKGDEGRPKGGHGGEDGDEDGDEDRDEDEDGDEDQAQEDRKPGSLRGDRSAVEPRVVAAHQPRTEAGIVGVVLSPAVAVVAPGERVKFTGYGVDASGQRVSLGDASCMWLRARSGGDLDDGEGGRTDCSQTYRAGSAPGADRIIHLAVTLQDGTTVAAEARIQIAVPAAPEDDDEARPRYRARLQYLEPGAPVPVALPPQASVALLTLDAASPSLGEVDVTVETLEGLPPEVPAPNGAVHAFVEISARSVAGDQDLRGASLVFRVASEAVEAGCPAATCGVRVLHFANGAWETLEASFVGTQNGSALFESHTTSFSPFAILFDVTAAGQDGRTAGGVQADFDVSLGPQTVEEAAALSEVDVVSSDVVPVSLPLVSSATVEASASALILLIMFLVGAAPGLALKTDEWASSRFPNRVKTGASVLWERARTGAQSVSTRAKRGTARARRTAARAKPVLTSRMRKARQALGRLRVRRNRRDDNVGSGSTEGDFGSLF